MDAPQDGRFAPFRAGLQAEPVCRTYPENKGRSGDARHGFVVRHQGVRQSGVIRDGTSLRFVPDYERAVLQTTGYKAQRNAMQVATANRFDTIFRTTSTQLHTS